MDRIPDELARRVSGTVQLKLRIGADGTVRQAEVMSGPGEIAAPLAAAARKYVYEHPIVNGHPAEITTLITCVIVAPPER